MKPAPFEYFAPTDMAEALDLLAHYGDEAKILAGGQSLMPLMNMRLARPRVLVDINRLSALSHISLDADGALAIGALTRQRAIERASLIQTHYPLLAAVMPSLGHFQIRNRGTIGGSIVHADPAAELPALCLALEAEFVLRSAVQQRTIRAAGLLSHLSHHGDRARRDARRHPLSPLASSVALGLPGGLPSGRGFCTGRCRGSAADG